MSEEYICINKQMFLILVAVMRVIAENYEKIEKMIKEELKHMHMKTGFAS
jgi:hypothetical protein